MSDSRHPAHTTKANLDKRMIDTSVASFEDEASDEEKELQAKAEKSSNMVSVLVIISRITGFMRTWAQANAIGVSMLASCYTVAATMPNFLYELVMGGMLITSFLPVYMSVKNRLGSEEAAKYASNLLSLVLILMAIVTAISWIFAAPLIWTQSAGASSDFDFNLAVFFFRFFAFEIILYALSSIISGVLNAERDYFWSNAAPILNNVITIASFSLYSFAIKTGVVSPQVALLILAIGNPLGVAVQVFAQIPALRKHGVKLRPHVDLHDPAIRETLSIGLPTLIVTFASFPTSAVQSSCALQVTASGASIAYYSRVWYVLPYSILAIPISVTMFTELSAARVAGDMNAFVRDVSAGAKKIMFTLIPFVFFLILFAPSLISIVASGAFDQEDALLTVRYLQVQALALPFFGLSTYLQKVCSSLLKMKFYAFATCVAAVIQVACCLIFTQGVNLYVVPLSSTFFFIAIDAVTLLHLRRELGPLHLSGVIASSIRGCIFGLLGTAVGFSIIKLMSFVLPSVYSSGFWGLIYAVCGGIPALIASFGLATRLGKSDAPFFDAIFSKISRVLSRA